MVCFILDTSVERYPGLVRTFGAAAVVVVAAAGDDDDDDGVLASILRAFVSFPFCPPFCSRFPLRRRRRA